MSLELSQLTAEQRFRQAFERLKAGEPKVLPEGTPISQNNIAKEAGCDPSALRKSRFPSLIREIQTYIELHQEAPSSQRQELLKQREKRRNQRGRLNDVEVQRDFAQSQLASANRRIIELTEELKLIRMQLEELRPPPVPLWR